MKRIRLPIFLFALALLATGVQAQSLTWYVQGSFNDTGTLNGYFNYSPTDNVYSQINIATTPGTIRTSGAIYSVVCGTPDVPGCGDGFSPQPESVIVVPTNVADQTGNPSLFMRFSQKLSDSLFASNLAISDDEGNCADSVCTTIVGATDRKLVWGSAVSGEPLFEYLYFGS